MLYGGIYPFALLIYNAHKLREDLTHLVSELMEPALRPEFTVDEIEDKTVVAVEIDEIPATQKPYFYKQAGLPKAAFQAYA